MDTSQGRVQVILLRDPPSSGAMETALIGTTEEDLLRPRGSDIFWLPRAGISDSGLDVATLECHLGPVTVRAHNTIVRLAERV